MRPLVPYGIFQMIGGAAGAHPTLSGNRREILPQWQNLEEGGTDHPFEKTSPGARHGL